MHKDENYKIELDIDRDRIKSILTEAYHICEDMLETTFKITVEQFVTKVEPFLNSNRVTMNVLIHLPSDKYQDLNIEVNFRKKSLIARMSNRTKRVLINRYLTKL